jgi:anaerobic ribonucleoside-triphosphate reductase activating protein
MRYSSINTCECTNGLGWGVSLFTQGCPIHCKGCFNPETWDFNGGKELTQKQESEIYKALKLEYISRFSVLGGEPLIDQNLPDLNRILCTIKTQWPNKKIWIYTGYTWDQLQKRQKELLPNHLLVTFKYTDYLVCGPFIQEEKDLTLKWRGSRNQIIVNIEEAFK